MSDRLSRKERLGLYLHRTLDKCFSRLGVALFGRTKGGISERIDVDVLALTTVGCKSGKWRSVLLQYFPDGEDMLVLAANSGADRHPVWCHNLMAQPEASVEVRGRTLAARATQSSREEAEATWPAILERTPDYERYRRATDRVMPILPLRVRD